MINDQKILNCISLLNEANRLKKEAQRNLYNALYELNDTLAKRWIELTKELEHIESQISERGSDFCKKYGHTYDYYSSRINNRKYKIDSYSLYLPTAYSHNNHIEARTIHKKTCLICNASRDCKDKYQLSQKLFDTNDVLDKVPYDKDEFHKIDQVLRKKSLVYEDELEKVNTNILLELFTRSQQIRLELIEIIKQRDEISSLMKMT